MALIIEQRNGLDVSTARLISLISDHQADFGAASATTGARSALVRAGVNVTRVAAAHAKSSPISVSATPHASW
jgi:hypothetical protein